MKKRFFLVLLCCLTVILLLGAIPCTAQRPDENAAKAQEILDGILAYEGASDIQSHIDGHLTQNADSSEWYILALSQYGEYDFSSYKEALLSYLENTTVHAASSRLKYALTLASVGSTDAYILQTLDEAAGKQGLMSYVFALHLVNNGYACEAYTAAELKAVLLERQNEDGGWSVTGKTSDVDATAMTMQALAPLSENDTEVKAATDKALALLSERQLAGGDFSSYGEANPESTAQVLIALASLGIDPMKDERFIKNGNTLLDGITKYKCADGSFAHTEGGASAGTASVQVFCAMVSYLRLQEDKAPFYVLDFADPASASSSPDAPQAPDEENDSSSDDTAPEKKTGGYKWWVSIIIVGIGGAVSVLLFILKKRHIKNFIAVAAAVSIAVTAVCVTNFQSADDYYGGAHAPKENAIGNVTLTIRCDTVAGAKEHIPENGVILEKTTFEIAEGDTVYSILTEAAQKHRIQLENDGTASLAYITGIAYLYEFDFGDLSGWVFFVNGERTSVGAGEYKLKDGDAIEWHYTCDLGEDLK